MSDLQLNPLTTGLIGAAIVMVGQAFINRITGWKDEKSIPTELAEIKAKLTSIEATLLIIKNNAEHMDEKFEELKSDFWAHMDKFHSGHGSSSGSFRSYEHREKR